MTRLLTSGILALATATTAAVSIPQPSVTVRSEAGVYTVQARFEIDAPVAIVRGVLTDYVGIPRFMPDVRTSVVRERAGDTVVVEQEAVSKMAMFSKRVHLLLDVREGERVITFRDRCGASFSQYEGSWTMSGDGPRATIAYALTAKPSFAVPSFMVRRQLERNARELIEHLRAEAVSRARR